MNKKSMIDKVKQNILFKKMEQQIFSLLTESPNNLSEVLKRVYNRNSLSEEDFGDFIQKILLNKDKLHKENPQHKIIIRDFAKENKILGLIF